MLTLTQLGAGGGPSTFAEYVGVSIGDALVSLTATFAVAGVSEAPPGDVAFTGLSASGVPGIYNNVDLNSTTTSWFVPMSGNIAGTFSDFGDVNVVLYSQGSLAGTQTSAYVNGNIFEVRAVADVSGQTGIIGVVTGSATVVAQGLAVSGLYGTGSSALSGDVTVSGVSEQINGGDFSSLVSVSVDGNSGAVATITSSVTADFAAVDYVNVIANIEGTNTASFFLGYAVVTVETIADILVSHNVNFSGRAKSWSSVSSTSDIWTEQTTSSESWTPRTN